VLKSRRNPGAQERLEPAHGSLWEEHRFAVRLWHREIADATDDCKNPPGFVHDFLLYLFAALVNV
jgi:hypothetical protein